MELIVCSGAERPTANDAILLDIQSAWTQFNEELIGNGSEISKVQNDIISGGQPNWVATAEQSLQQHAPQLFDAVEAVRSALMRLEGRQVSWLQPHKPFEVHDPIPEEILLGSTFNGTHVVIANYTDSETEHSYSVYDRVSGLVVATDAGFHATQFDLGARLTMSIDGRRQPVQRLSLLREIAIVSL